MSVLIATAVVALLGYGLALVIGWWALAVVLPLGIVIGAVLGSEL